MTDNSDLHMNYNILRIMIENSKINSVTTNDQLFKSHFTFLMQKASCANEAYGVCGCEWRSTQTDPVQEKKGILGKSTFGVMQTVLGKGWWNAERSVVMNDHFYFKTIVILW